MLSLKSMWICSHIRTQLLDILSVHSFHVETLATALDHELVTKFAKEFMDLYNGNYFIQSQIRIYRVV